MTTGLVSVTALVVGGAVAVSAVVDSCDTVEILVGVVVTSWVDVLSTVLVSVKGWGSSHCIVMIFGHLIE